QLGGDKRESIATKSKLKTLMIEAGEEKRAEITKVNEAIEKDIKSNKNFSYSTTTTTRKIQKI
ncbi:unnamed protein product, partial [Ceratitis capitata]